MTNLEEIKARQSSFGKPRSELRLRSHVDIEDIQWLIARVEQLERENMRSQEQCDYKDQLLESQGRAMDEDNRFTCLRCGATSYNPNDKREGYCGRCHDWTAEPQSKDETGSGS